MFDPLCGKTGCPTKSKPRPAPQKLTKPVGRNGAKLTVDYTLCGHNLCNTQIVPTHLGLGLLGGGTFLQSLVLQAFSDVMVIIDEVANLQRGQFTNSGPHPAILLLTHPIEK